VQDITAHLHGGVPERDIDALGAFWAVMPTLRATLFGPNPRPGYADPLVAPDQVRATIRNHPDFAAFRAQITAILDGWIVANTPRLMGISQGDHPRDLIHTIAEDMLARFDAAPLIDKYDAYQRLMSCWADTMQDDVFIIAGGGWLATTAR
jgi:type I restriction enzyme M protein